MISPWPGIWPKDIFTEGHLAERTFYRRTLILAEGHFTEEHLAERTFSRMDKLMAERTFRRADRVSYISDTYFHDEFFFFF